MTTMVTRVVLLIIETRGKRVRAPDVTSSLRVIRTMYGARVTKHRTSDRSGSVRRSPPSHERRQSDVSPLLPAVDGRILRVGTATSPPRVRLIIQPFGREPASDRAEVDARSNCNQSETRVWDRFEIGLGGVGLWSNRDDVQTVWPLLDFPVKLTFRKTFQLSSFFTKKVFHTVSPHPVHTYRYAQRTSM